MSTAARVLALLLERGQTVAAAESLTGGLVAAELTRVPGASRGFLGSVTAYATPLKHRLLGVDADLLDARGAVDPEVAAQMARGVRDRLGADWGVSTTGVAGPEPQDGRPVGTVYVAVAGPATTGAAAGKVVSLRLNGDRAEIRRESVRSALELLHEELSGNARAQDTEQNGGNGCLQP
ncbi:CinA family protein [Streptomyces filamentosus]|uniref:Competence damage-inducible protein A n=1 Tax=Streptomyces filamentosus TaxID=67294 RepID=A0A919EH66_STRFL|nr:CinA family protein [Streptomyces filamentosus]KAA6219992.1 CinA family protein [Streptomyces filamentosus]GHF82639.1 competence damage-inducible protein A [Streptomyces filamentosus]